MDMNMSHRSVFYLLFRRQAFILFLRDMKKVLFFIAMGVILNGCTQYSSFLGPTYTIATTGNVYQAGLYYQSSSLIKKKTGKSESEVVKIMRKFL